MIIRRANLDARSFRIPRVPPSYEPRFPRRLSADEFRELIAQRMPSRLSRVAALASVAFSLAACDPDVTPKPPSQSIRPLAPQNLEERVLAVLQRLRDGPGNASWFAGARFTRAGEDTAKKLAARWDARIPISFGNSYNGIFDVKRARDLAAATFAAYGIDVTRNVEFTGPGCAAMIDGYDPKSGLGFELRDVGEDDGKSRLGNAHFVSTVSAAENLDDDEAAKLRESGFNLEVENPRSLYDGDEFTPGLAYLASLIEYLNSATDGPDFDLGALLFRGREIVTVEPAITPAPAKILSKPDDAYLQIEVWKPTTVVLEVAAGRTKKVEYEMPNCQLVGRSRPERTALPALASNRQQPTCVIAGVGTRLVQPSAGDGKELIAESRNGIFFLPSRFDASKPFRIEGTLEPYSTASITREIVIGLPAD